MKTRIIPLLALTLSGLWTLPIRAATPNEFPAETQWVLSLDMKAAQTSPLLNFIVSEMTSVNRQQTQAKLAAVKAAFGEDLLSEINQIVVAGHGNSKKGGVAYVYGAFDVRRLQTALASKTAFTSAAYGDFKILQWEDNGPKFLSFAKPNLVLLANVQSVLTEALDVLSGKRKGLSADSVFAATLSRAQHEMLAFQAVDVASIVGKQPKAQAFKQAEALKLCVYATQTDSLNTELAVTAANAETADQIRQALQGIQALALLRTEEAPDSATLASLTKIGGTGRTVKVTMDLPKSAIEIVMRQRDTRQAAAAAARTQRAADEPRAVEH